MSLFLIYKYLHLDPSRASGAAQNSSALLRSLQCSGFDPIGKVGTAGLVPRRCDSVYGITVCKGTRHTHHSFIHVYSIFEITATSKAGEAGFWKAWRGCIGPRPGAVEPHIDELTTLSGCGSRR